MFSFETIQKNQPVHLTGIIGHTFLWATSGLSDVIYKNPNFQATDENPGAAIYCIHGTADRVAAFSLVATRLQHKLPSTISSIHLLAFDHRGMGASIEDFALQILDKVKHNNDKNVILFGHSRGGLVAARFTEYLAETAGINVLGVVAIGTPFLGSSFALAPLSWLSTSIKQMERNSDFLIELIEKVKKSKAKYFYFVGANDSLVPVDSACLNQTTTSSILLDRHGHLSIMSSHRLVDHISRCLIKMTRGTSPNMSREDDGKQINLLNEFICIDDDSNPIINVYKAIDFEISKLRNRTHMWSPEDKIKILNMIQAKLLDLLNPDIVEMETYHANTISDYLTGLLNDENVNSGKTPLSVLKGQLNCSFIFFAKPKTESEIFIEKLLLENKDIPLSIKKKELTLSVVKP